MCQNVSLGRASLKIWLIITHEHELFDEKEKFSFILESLKDWSV